MAASRDLGPSSGGAVPTADRSAQSEQEPSLSPGQTPQGRLGDELLCPLDDLSKLVAVRLPEQLVPLVGHFRHRCCCLGLQVVAKVCNQSALAGFSK